MSENPDISAELELRLRRELGMEATDETEDSEPESGADEEAPVALEAQPAS